MNMNMDARQTFAPVSYCCVCGKRFRGDAEAYCSTRCEDAAELLADADVDAALTNAAARAMLFNEADARELAAWMGTEEAEVEAWVNGK
jgi:hypothetical protein